MNQTEANDNKHLAKSCNEALEKVTERECPNCTNTIVRRSRSIPVGRCSACSGTSKVRWAWEPEVGEWWLNKLNQKVHCIGNERELVDMQPSIGIDENIISILHWETIERVLEGVGYWMKMEYDGKSCYMGSEIGTPSALVHIVGESRQETVMKALIALGKEVR